MRLFDFVREIRRQAWEEERRVGREAYVWRYGMLRDGGMLGVAVALYKHLQAGYGLTDLLSWRFFWLLLLACSLGMVLCNVGAARRWHRNERERAARLSSSTPPSDS